jgi:hypothetical protein
MLEMVMPPSIFDVMTHLVIEKLDFAVPSTLNGCIAPNK